MPETSLLSRAKIFIEPADAAAGQRHLERVLERDAEGALAAVLAERPPARKLLLGVFGCSPHLANLAARDPARPGNLSSALRVFVLGCLQRGELSAEARPS